MKSESVSSKSQLKKPNWRLRTTLKRAVDYRPIEDADIKYAWAAYKKGAFSSIDIFADGLMSADEFKAAFEQFVLTITPATWTIFGKTKQGFIPTGIVFCAVSPGATYAVVQDIVWFPWASRRNIVEGTVNFFNSARKSGSFVGYALPEHRQMYEVCAMHGVMRRVGTSYAVIPGKPATVFETRAPS